MCVNLTWEMCVSFFVKKKYVMGEYKFGQGGPPPPPFNLITVAGSTSLGGGIQGRPRH